MSKNLLKWFFGTFALIAAAAFTGCSDDDNPENLVPQMSADPLTLTFENVEGEASKDVVVTANCSWKVNKSNLDWATVTPESGSGSGIITVKVKEISDGTKSRTGTISFNMITGIGDWGTDGSPKITVTQTDGDAPGPGPDPVGEVIWSETCGTADASAKPLVGDYTNWDTTGSGASTVTYTGVNTSVRASGLVNGGSGHNEIFFGKVPASFTANDITLTSTQTNLQLTFLGSRSVKTDDGYDNTFDPSKLTVALSKDGQSWTDITYNVTGGEEHPYWATCTADFTLKEAVSSLYIRFTASEASVIRIDDMKLATGNGGSVVDLGSGGDKPNPGGEVTIAEVIAGTVGNTYTTQGQVIAINGRSFLIQDNTGKILVYLGWDKDASAPVVSYDATIGQTVKVTGATTTYSKLVQFSETGLQIEKVSDGTFTQPAPKKFTGADFDAYKALATPTVEYIEYTGTLSISGFYYNVAVEGTTLQGSLAYPADGFVDAALNGQAVTVTGYTLGMTNSASMLSTIATSVVAAGEVPTEPAITKVDPTKLTFAAEGQTLSVNVTTANADGCTLTATTDNAAQFTATVSGLTSVSVTAKENATDAAINATLTISLMKGGAAVATKTVALTQNKKSENPGGGGYVKVTQLNAGKKYLLVAETQKGNYVFDASLMNNGKANGTEITVTDGKIESNDANNAYAVTITAEGDHYLIVTADGKYVEYSTATKPGTNLQVSDAPSADRGWVFETGEYPDGNTFLIKDISTLTASTQRAFLFQTYAQSSGAAKDFYRFGAYSAKNATADFNRDKEEYYCLSLFELAE